MSFMFTVDACMVWHCSDFDDRLLIHQHVVVVWIETA